MQWLFIVDPISSFQIKKDSTYAMMQAAQAQGYGIWVAELGDLYASKQRIYAHCRAITLQSLSPGAKALKNPRWYAQGEAKERLLSDFDAVLMRKDPPFDLEFLYATLLLEQAQREGAKVFNRPQMLRDHNEKLAILEFPQFIADTLVSRDPQRLRAFVQHHRLAIFKLLDGMGGASIFQARADDPNLSVILETMAQFGRRSVMAQAYIPEIRDGDKRVLLIGGEVVPFALARIPQAGEARGNLAAGGRAQARPLSAADRRIGEFLAPVLCERGLFLVGLDIIGEYLTEINVTSPTCFREIMDQTGFDVAELFVRKLAQACAS
ncbi:MAG: glutathione synthase [Betaproteobacteria bacterium]|jgi:glutathione synthase|nr:glutathione synthase [Pseudomonadota bacterium]NBO03248.1 glutathione synthase [Betaproteobacteria bacterium]NBO95909.1 glutathione synthase [Betaproteobacteria bacterium]NBP35751.1 glutathione synthase [Betaproteobacteria bacterium]NBP37776.1 glutathione synthase [Betaproteobacteria bacterium]